MRHGKAEARGVDWPVDELRPLSAAGRQRARDRRGSACGVWAYSRNGRSAARSSAARQTAEIVHVGLKLERPIELVDSLGGWRLSSIIADASMAEVESVLLVGHEPTLSELIGLLIGARGASIR